jgi:hypothetical protein
MRIASPRSERRESPAKSLAEGSGRVHPAAQDRSDSDRPYARSGCLARYLGYLLDGANLMLIDVHRRPKSFSFADQIAAQLHIEQPSVGPPLAVSYRAGESAPTGGRFLAIWRRPLSAGEPLPTLPLPLTPEQAVAVELEVTYTRAAADAYLS